jgi:hypothetical protein
VRGRGGGGMGRALRTAPCKPRPQSRASASYGQRGRSLLLLPSSAPPPLLLLLLLLLLAQSQTPEASTGDDRARNGKPHLVFAMIDDWGFYEIGFRGNSLVQTPFVDKMIGEALLIERHYSYRFCSPARRSFLTGRLPPHVGQTNTPDATIDLRMKTIADKLAAAGYVTGHSGKVSPINTPSTMPRLFSSVVPSCI